MTGKLTKPLLKRLRVYHCPDDVKEIPWSDAGSGSGLASRECTPSRLRHILGVEQTAIELARAHHLDVEKTATAGLMHDLAKHFKPQKLLQMALAEGLELDPVLEASPHLLHAEVSATVAREEFGVCDEEVLQAIRNHTLGQPGMSELSCAVFLADSLEPGRGNTPELAELRQVSRQDLYKAVGLTCDYSLGFLLKSRQLIHPRTVLTRNWACLMQERKERKEKSLESAKTSCLIA